MNDDITPKKKLTQVSAQNPKPVVPRRRVDFVVRKPSDSSTTPIPPSLAVKPATVKPAIVLKQKKSSEPVVQAPITTAGLEQPKKKRSIKKIILGSFFGLLIAVIVALIGGWCWYNQQLQPAVPGSSEKVKVTIVPGTGPAAIAKQLKQSGVIRSEVAFDWYVRLKGKSGFLQSGVYRLSMGEDVPAIVEHLTSGKTDTFSITFLPGATLAEHRKAFLKAGYDAGLVDEALAKSYTGPLFAGKPKSADLEGYIYGETYSFPADATPEQILKRIFEHYYAVVKQEKLESLYKKRKFTLYQGITLASIIQREVATPKDAAQVSQVFQKRLAMGMQLGSDVTYQYIADKTGQERSVDLDSPYNTRRYKGLTPGPISSPGLDALKAVGNPAPGDYVYFLSGDDDVTYFARTNEEHERNIAEHCKKKCQII